MSPIDPTLKNCVGEVAPRLAGVRGAPDAAAGGAHVEGVRLLRNPRDRRDAPAASGPDVAIFEVREERLRDLGEWRDGRTPRRSWTCLRPAVWGAYGDRSERDTSESETESGRTAWVHLAPRRE